MLGRRQGPRWSETELALPGSRPCVAEPHRGSRLRPSVRGRVGGPGGSGTRRRNRPMGGRRAQTAGRGEAAVVWTPRTRVRLKVTSQRLPGHCRFPRGSAVLTKTAARRQGGPQAHGSRAEACPGSRRPSLGRLCRPGWAVGRAGSGSSLDPSRALSRTESHVPDVSVKQAAVS